jgi:DNA-directed RNA polymerase subunit RPC12/RpoP
MKSAIEWVCEDCGETFLEPENFVEIINKNKSYNCPKCGRNSKWHFSSKTIDAMINHKIEI